MAIEASSKEVFLINISAGEAQRLTWDGNEKLEAAISDSYVAWIASSNDTTTTEIGPSEATDIFLVERASGRVFQITDSPVKRRHLQIDGHRLVWQDRRNEFNEDSDFYDIYAYDAQTRREIPIAVAHGAQIFPTVQRDRVAWLDDRGNPDEGFEIRVYEFSTGNESAVATTPYKYAPKFYGDYLVWWSPEGMWRHDFRSGEYRQAPRANIGTSELAPMPRASETYVVWYQSESILGHDLETGKSHLIAHVGYPGAFAAVTVSGLSSDGRYVIWAIRHSCDVLLDRPSKPGVFAYDFQTGRTYQLTDYTEPSASIVGNIAIIHEKCHMIPGPGWIYAVFLDEQYREIDAVIQTNDG